MDRVTPDEILENLSDGIYYVDLNRQIVYWNRAAERITGFSREEVLCSHCYDNILNHIDANGLELCKEGCPITRAIQEDLSLEARVFLRTKDGHRKPVSVRVAPIKDSEGIIVGAVEIFTDNSNYYLIREEMEALKREVYTDELTRVGNRKYFEFIINSKIFEVDTYRMSIGLIFFDIDNFKHFNDDYGHRVGDQILKAVAKSSVNAVRAFDYVCRWGGEEFAIVITNTGEKMLQEIGERVRGIIENSYIIVGGKRVGVTVSIGATMVNEGDSESSLLDRVDALMYGSKEKGKNRVTFG